MKYIGHISISGIRVSTMNVSISSPRVNVHVLAINKLKKVGYWNQRGIFFGCQKTFLSTIEGLNLKSFTDTGIIFGSWKGGVRKLKPPLVTLL